MSDQAFNEAEEASSLLLMARELHEKHVSEAREEAASIVAKAKSEAETLVSNAKAERDQIKADSLQELEQLQQAIAEHREFEDSYRNSLKSYLSNLLGELDGAKELEIEVPESVNLDAYTPATPAFEVNTDDAYVDPDDTFADDAITPEQFDTLAYPDPNAEDVDFGPVTEAIPLIEEVEVNEEESSSIPSFDLSSPETDSIETIIQAEEENATEAQFHSVEVEFDNDGGSTIDGIEDDPEVTVPEQVPAFNEDTFVVDNNESENNDSFAETDEVSPKEELVVEEPVDNTPKFGSFESFVSGNTKDEKPEEEDGEKKRFRFFGGKD